ncbi:MAG: hypothetical protein L0I62_05220 [Gammaproteobacteria bacterium]|nr:hypothetical protein [Gammaproteobacteria bacterium]
MYKILLMVAFTAALALAATPVFASWSDDPASNLAVGFGTGGQDQAKVVPTPDGGSWISWFDGGTGGYDVWIQRLDAAGNKMLGPNGIRVAQRYFSSTQDYGLSVDADGNALLAFRITDQNQQNLKIEAQKVAPDGTLLWGANGVQLGNSADFLAVPKITATSDGDIVVGWTDNSNMVFARLDANGDELWNPEIVVSDPNGDNLTLSDLHGAEAGSAILSYVSSGSFSDPKHLFAQKLDTAGASEWTATVFDGGSLQFGNFPGFIPDGSGGAVFAWYDSGNLQSHVQHIAADGSEVFAHNGVLVATTSGDIQVSPSAAYYPATQDIFVAWTEEDALTQGDRGVSVQKIDASGNLEWGASGITVVPKTTNADYLTNTVATSDDGAIFIFSGGVGFGQDQLYATRLDTNGANVWNPGTVTLSSTPAEKFRLNTIILPNDMAIVAWTDDGGTGDFDVLAQNVNGDGTLGASGCAPGYTEFSGHLDAGESFTSAPIEVAQAGQKYVDLTSPASFGFFAIVTTRFGTHTYVYPHVKHGHRRGAAGTYQVGVQAGATGGDFTLCVDLDSAP